MRLIEGEEEGGRGDRSAVIFSSFHYIVQHSLRGNDHCSQRRAAIAGIVRYHHQRCGQGQGDKGRVN
jgi:hypothetical protein